MPHDDYLDDEWDMLMDEADGLLYDDGPSQQSKPPGKRPTPMTRGSAIFLLIAALTLGAVFARTL